MLKGFRDFMFRGNVIDLAVGIVIGAAFSGLVNSFVANLIMTPIAAVFGKPNFDALVLGPFHYGAFLTVLVQFLLVATAIYFAVVLPMNHMAKRLGLAKEPPVMRECPECKSSIPGAATRCMYCTSESGPSI